MSYRILVVEDEPELRELTRSALGKLNDVAGVEGVSSGEEAVALLSGKIGDLAPTFDLVVADIRLPGNMNGVDLWRYCFERWPRLPCLLVSGMALPELYRQMGQREIAPTFLSKPTHPGELLQVARCLLDHSRSQKDPSS